MKEIRVSLGSDDDPVSPDARMSLTVLRRRRAAKGVAVIVHGRNGAAAAAHMRLIASPYLALGMTVVLPDCCNSAHNDSAGSGDRFTLSAHVRDSLRTVDWALAPTCDLGWKGADIVLAGHSMGAYAVGLLAATRLAGRCRHVLLASPFVSGRHQIAARAEAAGDGLVALAREVPQALTEWPHHDLLRHAARITCPAATVVGDIDTVTPDRSVRELGSALPRAISHTVLARAHHSLEGGPHEAVFLAIVEGLEAAAETA